MPYILPDGNYYDAGDHVAARSVACAVRPDGYVLANNWRSSPLDVSVCWRPETQVEIDAQIQSEEDEFNFPNVMVTIANTLRDHENRILSLNGKPSKTHQQVIKDIRKL